MILQVEARNYRCLRFVRQALPSFAVLAGPSGSGKSTLLDIPLLLGDLVRGRAGVEAAVAARAGTVEELTWLRQGGGIELAVEAQVPAEMWRQGPGPAGRVRYEVSLGRREPGAPMGQPVGLLAETLWLRPAPVQAAETDAAPTHAAPTLFPLPEPPEESVVCPPGYPTPAGWRRVVHKAPNAGNDYFRSEVSEWNNTYRLGPGRSALANLPEDEDQFPAAVWFRRLLVAGIHRLALEPAALRRPSLPGAAPQLATDGGNLPAVVQALEQGDPARLAAWLAHVRVALPELAGLGTMEANGLRRLWLRYAGGLEIPAEQAAEGTLRLLALTALAYGPSGEGVWMVEAPEQGLHPLALEPVMQALQSLYGAQVVVTTYAPGVVGMVDPACVLLFGRDGVGATTIIPAAEHERVKAAQGAVNLGTLYAAGALG